MVEGILRAAAIYFFLIVCFRLSGRRTIGQATTFDMMLMLIISEAVSPALTNGNQTLGHAFTLVLTLVGLNVLMSIAKFRSQSIDRLIDGKPVVLVRHGTLERAAMRRSRVDEEDLLEAARQEQGVSSLADVELATLERSGHISIVPRSPVDGR